MLQYIFWTIVIYLLFRFIFNFVVPVIRVGRQMRRQMNDFQQTMHSQQQPQGNYSDQKDAEQKPRKRSEDYIDFEEVKN